MTKAKQHLLVQKTNKKTPRRCIGAKEVEDPLASLSHCRNEALNDTEPATSMSLLSKPATGQNQPAKIRSSHSFQLRSAQLVVKTLNFMRSTKHYVSGGISTSDTSNKTFLK